MRQHFLKSGFPIIQATRPRFSSTLPPSSERDEKRDGVGQALRFGLHAGDRSVEQAALCVNDVELRHAAEPRLLADLVEIFFRGVFREARVLDGARVRLQRAKSIGDVAKRLYHRVAILRLGLLKSSFRGLLFVQQRHAVERRLRDVSGERIEPRARREKLRELEGAGPAIGGQHDIRQSRRDSDADLGAGRVNAGFGGLDVGPLRDGASGKADWKLSRQGDMREVEGLADLLRRITSRQRGEEITLRCEPLFEIGESSGAPGRARIAAS